MEHIQKLESAGVEMLTCITCLEYFNLIDKLFVGKPTTMAKSIEAMHIGDFVAF